MARRDLEKEKYVEPMPNEFYCWGDIQDVGLISKRDQTEKQIQDAFGSIKIEEDSSTPETDYVLKVLGKDSGARIVIPFDAVVRDAYFDKETKEIVLIVVTAQGDKEIRVDVKDLVDTYTGDGVTIKVDNHVISITDDVMEKFSALEDSIKEEERRAETTEKSLKESIDGEIERAEKAEQANAEAISKIETDYKEADETLKKELDEKTKNMVEWQYSSEDRKHIVLGNHENILGTSTEGGTYNLAMVSKWNVADFGSSSLPMNLNATDGKVTINDDKVVATTDDITNAIEGLASETYVDTAVSNENKRAELAEEELSDKIDKIELKKETDLLYALYVNGVKHGEINIPKDQFLKDITYDSTTKELVFTFETSDGEKVIRVAIGDLIDTYTAGEGLTLNDNVFSVDFDKVASVEYVDEKTKNMVEWEYSTEDRKHIVLDNHSNILGKSTEGDSYNLAMVSKWDVADFGSSQLHTNLNSKDGQVTINDEKVVATVDDVNSSEERLQEKIDTKANKEHTHEISEVVNLQSTLDTKLNIEDVQAILKEQIYKLFNIDMIKAEEFVATEMNNSSEKYAVIGNGEVITLTSTKTIIAEELKMNDIDISSEADNKGLLSISANKVEIEDTNISGSWDRSIGGNTMVTVNNAQNVSLKDVTVSRTNGYNAIEVGLDGKGTSKTIVIDGLEVTEKLSNNGINIFSFEDNADVVIKNCHFTEVSNPIRISNATYAKNVNITIKDCTFDKWESGSPAYAGLILLQDYTSKTKEEALEKKPFATFTITLDNVTGPYGKIDNTSTIEEICGSGIVDKQLVYVYADKAGLIPYDEDTFPTIIIK